MQHNISSTAAQEAIDLLQQLIAIPSLSKEEKQTADLLESFLESKQLSVRRLHNNVWVKSKDWDSSKPTLLLNSHHDTVKASSAYTRNPFSPIIENGKLYGLGSNDAGGPLVSLMQVFFHFESHENRKYNLIFAATAEEENSGSNGIESLLPHIGKVDLAIIGEPTSMQLAVAEKGLLVLDCISHGISSHAAHVTVNNAISNAIQDIYWFNNNKAPKISPMLGEVRMNVTMIHAGSQHNVIPDRCTFTVDVRCTDAYTHDELLDYIRDHVRCDVHPRSLRLNPSSIDMQHPLVIAAQEMYIPCYGSPTISDQALIPYPSVKIGPGDSMRSHTADEFIFLSEIENGISTYISLLSKILH